MRRLKYTILTSLILMLLNSLIGQNHRDYFKAFPVDAIDIPQWAQLMYADDPCVHEVQSALDKYISTHGFSKNIHTQNYKHWIRQVSHQLDEEGYIRPESKKATEARLEMLQAKRNSHHKQMAPWLPMGPFETYQQGSTEPYSLQTNVYAMDIYPDNHDILICGSETGTVFYSEDKGLNWTTISDQAVFAGGVTAVKIFPDDPTHFFVCSDNRIYETMDGGLSWTENYFLDGSANEFAFDPADRDHIFCSASSGLFESKDGGLNWERIQTRYCYDVLFHPTNQDIVYALIENPAAVRCEVLKSTDGGANWLLKTDGWYVPQDLSAAVVNGGKLGVSPDDPQRVYACLIGSSKANDNGWIGVYRSDDEGETWYNPSGQDGGPYNDVNNTPWNVAAYTSGYHQGYYNFDLEVSPNDADLLWIGTIRLSESSNGGYNFVSIGAANSIRLTNQHADIQDIEVVGDEVWVASDGGINYSNDDLMSGTSRKRGINGADFWGFGSGWNEDILVGGKYHNGNSAFYQTYERGVFHHVGGVEESTGYVHPMDSRKAFFNKYWAGGTETVIIPSEIGGEARYQGIFPYIPNESYSESWSSGFFFDPRYADHMYMGEGSAVWKSTNGGNYFEVLHDFGADRRVLEIKISRANPDVMYTVLGGAGYWDQSQMFVSEDGGRTWTQMTSLGTSMWRLELAINPENESEVWVSTTGGANGNKVFQSTDKGHTWINKTTSVLDGERIRDLFYQAGSGGVVYALSQYAIYKFMPDSDEWVNVSFGLPFVSKGFEMRPFYRDQKLRIATYGKGIWEINMEDYSQPLAQPMTHTDEVFCSRDTIQFDCYSILKHDDASWDWTFTPEPAFVSDLSSRNPKVVFGSEGAYDVTLTITDKFGTTSEKTIPDMVNVMNYCTMDGVPGMALQTYENGDYAQTQDFNREVSEFTVTAWVKPDGLQPEYTGIFMNDGPAGGFNFKNANNSLAYHWPGGAWWWDSGLTVPANKWSHVAMVVNPTSVTLYVNGIPSVHNIETDPLQLGTCKMGSYQGWDGRNYRGMLDEVAVWDRALSEEEIRQYRHLTKEDFQQDPNLLAYYQFNAPVAAVMDRVAGNHADLSRGAEKVISDGPFGTGTSSVHFIDTAGEYDYADEGLKLSFEDVSLPEGDVYITRINLSPDVLPNLDQSPEMYWVINNYGPRTVFDAAEQMAITPTDPPSNDEINDPAFAKLYGRMVHDTGDTWLEYCEAVSADNENFYFDASCQIRIEGQLYYSSGDDGLTSTEQLNDAQHIKMPKVYPNPLSAKDQLIVKNDQTDHFVMTIFDARGALISKHTIPGQSETVISDINMDSGLYFFKMKNDRYYTSGKIVVE